MRFKQRFSDFFFCCFLLHRAINCRLIKNWKKNNNKNYRSKKKLNFLISLSVMEGYGRERENGMDRGKMPGILK